MKKLAFLLLLGFTFSISKSIAQTTVQGVYLTFEDFKINHLSFTRQLGKNYKLHLNELFNKETLNITIGDSTYQLRKELLYGYRDQNNRVFRFYNHSDYRIINPSEDILLFCKFSIGGYKNAQTIVHYYFSKDASSAIIPLTKWNLKNAFPNDTVFHEFLDMRFSADQDLIGYDNFAQQTQLNHLFHFVQQLSSKK